MLTISFHLHRESSLSSLRGLGSTDNTPLTFAAASSPNTSITGPIQVRRKEGGGREEGGRREGGGREGGGREEGRKKEREEGGEGREGKEEGWNDGS